MCIRDRIKRVLFVCCVGTLPIGARNIPWPMRGQKRNVHEALRPAMGGAPAGSRRVKQRLEYNENSRSVFVELHPSFYPTLLEFKEGLEAVLGVEHVGWHLRRMDQQNLLVYSNIAGRSSASRPIEFEPVSYTHLTLPTNREV